MSEVQHVFGVGTDICDIRRIKLTLERHGERFARRILGPNEWRVFELRSARLSERGVRFVASRFSAKEAFSKAIGLGIRSPMQWRLCEVVNAPSGQPQVLLHGELKDWFEEKHLSAKVSLSDESDYAVSFVVVQQRVCLQSPAPLG
jgi:holo-[acyl-carrier-protein] synthase